MIPVVNNFVFDSYIGDQVVELEARVNQLKFLQDDTSDSISALSEDYYYYFHKVIHDQSNQIKNLTEILTLTVSELKKLTLKKESICTRLSEVIKGNFKLKKVQNKFAEYDKNLNFVIPKFNSLSLN